MKRIVLRPVAVILSVLLIISGSISVFAVAPRSTLFIAAQASSLERTTNTELKVSYYVDSWRLVDKLGVFSIAIQRSSDQQTWQTESAFYYWNNQELVSENTAAHLGSLYYNGTRGYYYRAEITYFASLDGSSEKTYAKTSTVYIPPSGNGGRVAE